MKVTMNPDGILHIIPENSLEIYALKKWKESSVIEERSDKYNEDFSYKGSKLAIWTEDLV